LLVRCLPRLLRLAAQAQLLLLLLLHMSLDLCWRQLGACRTQCRRVQWLWQRSLLHTLQQLNARLVPMLVRQAKGDRSTGAAQHGRKRRRS
jgi:hypothetical protein